MVLERMERKRKSDFLKMFVNCVYCVHKTRDFTTREDNKYETSYSARFSAICTVFKRTKLLPVVMEPTKNDSRDERRRMRGLDRKVTGNEVIALIKGVQSKLPSGPGASPFVMEIHTKLREILRRINDRSLEIMNEDAEDERLDEERMKLDRQIADLERQLKVVKLRREEICKDAPAVEATPNTRISLPPALPLTTDMLEPRGGKGAQLASCDQALFVAVVERPKTPEVAVVDRP